MQTTSDDVVFQSMESQIKVIFRSSQLLSASNIHIMYMSLNNCQDSNSKIRMENIKYYACVNIKSNKTYSTDWAVSLLKLKQNVVSRCD